LRPAMSHNKFQPLHGFLIRFFTAFNSFVTKTSEIFTKSPLVVAPKLAIQSNLNHGSPLDQLPALSTDTFG
jgi:hypothetical protein